MPRDSSLSRASVRPPGGRRPESRRLSALRRDRARAAQDAAGAPPANAVRLDLPEIQPGEEPDDRYRRAARLLAGWREDGTLRKEPSPSIYVYEQTYRVPGSRKVRTQRGFFGRLRLEDLVAGSGVLPHERTLSAPKEDRYKLLRATGVNTSPVVGLFADRGGKSVKALAAIAAGPARRRRRRRRRRSPPPLGRAGERAGGRARWPGSRCGAPQADHDRRRASPLRDRPPLPGRASGEQDRRGGSRLRLRDDAVPRDHRSEAARSCRRTAS